MTAKIYLTPEQISTVTKAKIENVRANWPLVCDALARAEINSPSVQAGMAATIAIETGNFQPVKEKESKNPASAVYKAQRRYYPSGYYGRGYIQLTWKDNYKAAGLALGVDLLSKPDLALDPAISARIAAWFFQTKIVGGNDKRRLCIACADADWAALRRGINGPGYTKDAPTYSRYLRFCELFFGYAGKGEP